MNRSIFVALAFLGISFATNSAQAGIGPAKPAHLTGAVVSGDLPFRGTIALTIDATDTDHRIFKIHETIPVQASGSVKLVYPEWETGSHAPTASVIELAGLITSVDDRRKPWHRDPVDVHAFRLDVPSAAKTIDVDFQFLAPHSAALLRPDMVDVQWHRLLLYPAGWPSNKISVAARLTLPHGLHAFTALPMERSDDDTIAFAPVSLETLVDAPVYAARYWRQLDLAPDAAVPLRLDIVADAAIALAVPIAELAKLRVLVAQTRMLLGPGPYRHYDAIVSLSDVLSPGGGIEHSEESENNLPLAYFTDLGHQLGNRDLIAHEYVHAWNGRFRQPTDLRSPDFNHPLQGSLLWVYEGQTEFWGRVLAARSGLRNRQETLDKLALDAALVENRAGRSWKSLEDSTNDAVYMAGHSIGWRDWQRREDYYPEGVLLWLDVDARLREQSHGRFSLDDFAGRFFATGGATNTVRTYDFDDVCIALNAVVPDNWAGFLRRHLDSVPDVDALAGLARAGWRLVYTDEPTETFRQDEADAGVSNLDYSIGVQVRPSGVIRSVTWDSPAFKAGLAPDDRISEVNAHPYTAALLEAAIKVSGSVPLTLTVEIDGSPRKATIAYRGSLRYPRLVRIPGKQDRLAGLLSSRIPKTSTP